MPRVDRRAFLLQSAAALALPRTAAAATITDGAGRAVAIPERVTKVFAAGPPAAVMLYTLAPDLLPGWPRANRAEACEFLLPDVCRRPEFGRLTGRDNTINLEAVIALGPELIVDVGAVGGTFASLADRVQSQTGIPYALLDGRLATTETVYRDLGRLLHREADAEPLAVHVAAVKAAIRERVARIPAARRPRVYYARGRNGLNTAMPGSINLEPFEIVGANNVAAALRGGYEVSLEQVLVWDPEVIVTNDREFAGAVRTDRNWQSVAALRSGRVHLTPDLPFGWVNFVPSVNRVIGLPWLAKVLYPDDFPEDLRAPTRDFYAKFYHVTLSDAQIDRLLAARG